MGEKTRQDVIDSLRRKILGLHRFADLMALTYDKIGCLGNAIGKLTEDMIDTLDTLEDGRDDE